MTGKSPRKAVDGGHAQARLLQAREFHESARSLVTLVQARSYNGAITLMVAKSRSAAGGPAAQSVTMCVVMSAAGPVRLRLRSLARPCAPGTWLTAADPANQRLRPRHFWQRVACGSRGRPHPAPAPQWRCANASM
jgi:hypothetical protein